MSYYVYMIRCEDNSLYTGITTDLMRRLKEHTSKNGEGAKYTFSHKPLGFAVAWKTESGRSMASKLEARLKKLKKTDKERLVKNPELLAEYLDERFETAEFLPVDAEKEKQT